MPGKWNKAIYVSIYFDNFETIRSVVVVVVVVVDGVSLSLNPRDMAVFSKSVYKH